MQEKKKVILLALLMSGFFVLAAVPCFAQDNAANNMQILLAKVKADKKLLVAMNMDLTESEAKTFWPVYDAYQKDLEAINQRIARLIESYAADYRGNSLTDDKARKLMSELEAILKAEAELVGSYAPRLSKAVPPLKAARYLQIENKIRTAVKYELSDSIPLVQ